MTNLAKVHDDELLAAIAAGNLQALEELFLSYHGRLARFLSHCTLRNEDVEEIISDIFMIVWQKAMDFRHASQASTWIIGVAYHRALKSRPRQKKFASARRCGNHSEQSDDPAQRAESEDLLANGLNRLPLEQRLTLVLAYQMGHSLEEIAAITDSPVETVKARMFHAHAELRLYLPRLGGSDVSRTRKPKDLVP